MSQRLDRHPYRSRTMCNPGPHILDDRDCCIHCSFMAAQGTGGRRSSPAVAIYERDLAIRRQREEAAKNAPPGTPTEQPKFRVGDRVTHTDGYSARIGTVVAVHSMTHWYNSYLKVIAASYRYVVEWPPHPDFIGWKARRPYRHRTSGDRLVLVHPGIRPHMEREADKRGFALSTSISTVYIADHMARAPLD